jgi:hypothetical protein
MAAGDTLKGLAKSTRDALARQALQTARMLDRWVERLEDVISKQNIELYRRNDRFPNKQDNDDTVTLTLPRWELRTQGRDSEVFKIVLLRSSPTSRVAL